MRMGTMILLLAFVVETAFVAYCITTRSHQQQLKSVLRIGALAAFVLATLVSILWWGIRWYGLAALLLIWAALGAWALTARRPEKRVFSPWRSAFGALGRLLLIFIVVTPALIFPQFTLPPPTGRYAVATASYTYTDTSRVETFTTTGEHRKVNLGCWYPQDVTGRYPLAVFSHGAFGMKAGNTSTFMDLASHGYVVCSIDHPYHSLITVDGDGRRTTVDPTYFREVINSDNGNYDTATNLQIIQKWMAVRTGDIHFVLNTLKTQAENPGADEVYQRIDLTHIGLFGHSLGGAASAQVARERNDIDAVIDLDGLLLGEYRDYAGDSFVINKSTFPIPILILYTDGLARVFDSAQDSNFINPIKYIASTAPQAHTVYLKGANHFNVTDLPLISPLAVSMIIAMAPGNGGSGQGVDASATIEQMNRTVLEFFDVYLKGEGSFTTAGVH
jgi:dienelactone hydrolase